MTLHDFSLEGTKTGRVSSKDVVFVSGLGPRPNVLVNAVEITTRQHKHRRNQTLNYHLRIQKKWDKRARTERAFQRTSQPKTLVLSSRAFNSIKALIK